MKVLKNRRSKRFLSLILSALMVLSSALSLTAFASENEEVATQSEYTIITPESEEYAKALEVLGLTEEEARECSVYSTDVAMDGARVTIPTDGSFYYFPTFTFSESNGGSYWTCNGNRLKWGVTWSAPYETTMDLRLGIYLYRYPDQEIEHHWLVNTVTNQFTSDWISTTRNDHRFRYYASYLTYQKVGYATVTMYVATKNV